MSEEVGSAVSSEQGFPHTHKHGKDTQKRESSRGNMFDIAHTGTARKKIIQFRSELKDRAIPSPAENYFALDLDENTHWKEGNPSRSSPQRSLELELIRRV